MIIKISERTPGLNFKLVHPVNPVTKNPFAGGEADRKLTV